MRTGPGRLKIITFVLILIATVIGPSSTQNNETGPPLVMDEATASNREVISLGQVKLLYAQALADYYLGDYVKAEKTFSDLMGQIPEGLRDDLDFWLAECSFRLGRRIEAEAGFYGYLKRRPQGARTDLAWQRLNLLTNQGG